MTTEVYRSKLGRRLSVVIWAICVVGLATEIFHDPAEAILLLPWLGLLSLVSWAAYWNPELRVDDSGLRLVNVLRSIDLPWPSIQRIETRWALTLHTAYGHYAAWVAPAPGVRGAAGLNKAQSAAALRNMGGAVRPGDMLGSPSGDAAFSVRTRWEALQAAGYLDDPKLEFERPPVRWHWPTMIATLVLALGCGATLFF